MTDKDLKSWLHYLFIESKLSFKDFISLLLKTIAEWMLEETG